MKKDHPKTIDRIEHKLAKRYAAEKRFRWCGRLAIGFGVLCLLLMLVDILGKGVGAFRATNILLTVNFDTSDLGIDVSTPVEEFGSVDWDSLLRDALIQEFPEVTSREERAQLYSLVSNGAGFDLMRIAQKSPEILGTSQRIWLLADDDLDIFYKSLKSGEPFTARMTQNQQSWVQILSEQSKMDLRFNSRFLATGDSREPEQAGILGAVVGSFLVLAVTLALSFPVGVAAAIYLEEFAPENRFTQLIEVNINNLAAVPSIIFGLLGLSVFIGFFGVPRSVPLVGGLVLTLMTLPTIIISSRASLRAVPYSVREAAIGLGASKMQTIFHHVMPLALPGMLTGAIIGMAQALGETAPLLMIGMVAFVADIPSGLTDAATVLPVQIFLWFDSPERAFVEKTAAAIIVLLGFLMLMNLCAVILRRKLERRW